MATYRLLARGRLAAEEASRSIGGQARDLRSVSWPCLRRIIEALNRDAYIALIGARPTIEPGDVAITGDLPARKDERVRSLIQAGGAELRFLRPTRPT